jgi:hypothetical protein
MRKTSAEFEEKLSEVVDDLRCVLASYPLNWRRENTENVKKILRRLAPEIKTILNEDLPHTGSAETDNLYHALTEWMREHVIGYRSELPHYINEGQLATYPRRKGMRNYGTG